MSATPLSDRDDLGSTRAGVDGGVGVGSVGRERATGCDQGGETDEGERLRIDTAAVDPEGPIRSSANSRVIEREQSQQVGVLHQVSFRVVPRRVCTEPTVTRRGGCHAELVKPRCGAPSTDVDTVFTQSW